MTTTKVWKITGAPLFLLPVVLLVVLFGVAVLLAQVAPSRVTTGIYQVVVWEDANHVVIPPESLSCVRADGLATCTTPVGPEQLTVELTYSGVVEPGSCTARYGELVVSCSRQLGYYGHASNTVWLSGGLGLSDAQQAELRAAAPWWRVDSELWRVALALTGVLAVAAGVVTFLQRRHARPIAPDRRLLVVAGATVSGLGLLVAGGLVLGGSVLFVLSPFSLVATGTLAAWQWLLDGIPRSERRLLPAIATAAAVAVYTTAVLFIFLLQSGFID